MQIVRGFPECKTELRVGHMKQGGWRRAKQMAQPHEGMGTTCSSIYEQGNVDMGRKAEETGKARTSNTLQLWTLSHSDSLQKEQNMNRKSQTKSWTPNLKDWPKSKPLNKVPNMRMIRGFNAIPSLSNLTNIALITQGYLGWKHFSKSLHQMFPEC